MCNPSSLLAMTYENKRASLPMEGVAQVSSKTESPTAQQTESHRRGKNRKVRYESVYEIDNLRKAEREARRGKSHKYGVRIWDKNAEENIMQLQEELRTRNYHTTPPRMEAQYTERKGRKVRKVRNLSKVTYRDLVAQHAFMRVISPVLNRAYYYDSAAGIKGRGIHYAMRHVRKWIDLHRNTPLWWAQVDFTKFYHYINRQKIYDRLCREFNDDGIRYLLHEIIWAMGNHNGLEPSDGTEGMGIGLYPVQPLVNFYTGDMARDINSLPGVRLFVYCDNNLIIGTSAKAVWQAVNRIRFWADSILCQPIHQNIGVQRLDHVHPIDFVGYLFFPEHTLVRKTIKETFKRKYKQYHGTAQERAVMASYKGWLSHADALHLWQNITGMKSFSELGLNRVDTMRNGQRFFEVPNVSAQFLTNRQLIVKDFIEDVSTKNGSGRMCILVEEGGKDCKFLTNNPRLKDIMCRVRELDELPFTAILRSRNLTGGKIEYYFE